MIFYRSTRASSMAEVGKADTARWKCTVANCPADYSAKNKLKAHVRTKHTMITCTECGVGYAGTDGLRVYVCVRASVCARR